MRISIIVAVAENGVIGQRGQLPWRLSADLQRFKRLTMGHTIIMGRRTWESIGRALPGRRTVVVTRQAEYRVADPSVSVVGSFDEALAVANSAGDSEAFVVGGSEIYRAALSRSDRLYITIVMADVDGDTYFVGEKEWRDWDWDSWVAVENELHEADEKNEHPYAFVTFQRCEPKIAS
jgi:dihydrofolate reductase